MDKVHKPSDSERHTQQSEPSRVDELTLLLLGFCPRHVSILKMEAMCSPETSVDFNLNIQRHNLYSQISIIPHK
jgi:hypothetical protein